jgi:hypothetical protein
MDNKTAEAERGYYRAFLSHNRPLFLSIRDYCVNNFEDDSDEAAGSVWIIVQDHLYDTMKKIK